MKQIITACILLMATITCISCKKELSCEGCKDGNKPPIANAGSDQTINLPVNSVTLDGSSSTDPDKNIVNYRWTKISGPIHKYFKAGIAKRIFTRTKSS